jgi:hypothetical protein
MIFLLLLYLFLLGEFTNRDVMSAVNFEHEFFLLLDCSLVEVSLTRGITDDNSILVHRLDMLPGVFILPESEVFAFAIWSWLIAVDLSVVE